MAAKTQANKKTTSTKKPRNQQNSKQPTEAGQSNRRTASKSAAISTKKKTPNTTTAKAQTSRNDDATKSASTKATSGLDLAAQVLAQANEPLNAKTIAERVIKVGWQTDGKTPWATLYASMTREIAHKGKAARFRKVARGQFTVSNQESVK